MIYTHTLADAIERCLRSKTWPSTGGGVTFVRTRSVRTDLTGLIGTQVSIIPFGTGMTLDAEGVYEANPDIRMVVQRKLEGQDAGYDRTLADAAAQVTEEICAHLVGREFLGFQCQSAKPTPSYDPAKLQTLDVFDATIHTLWKAAFDGPDD
jgi:hypothetical protein